jgi:hypothetical protein
MQVIVSRHRAHMPRSVNQMVTVPRMGGFIMAGRVAAELGAVIRLGGQNLPVAGNPA